MKSDQILDTLRSLRRRLRFLLVVDGVARLTAACLGAFGVLAMLDWLVHFPSFLRAAGACAVLAWALVWFVRRIWRPACSPISLDQMALRLGRLTPDFRDRLASAVAFLQGAGDGSPQLWQQVLANTADAASTTPMASAISARRPWRSTLGAAALLAVLAAATRVMPSAVAIGWHRLATPFANVHWPKRVQIAPRAVSALVAYGEGVDIEMELRRGDDEGLRGFLTWQAHDGRPRTVMMRRQKDGVYRHRLETLRSDIQYWFSAGDDVTADRPLAIRVVRRPAVESARFIFFPPPYAIRRDKRVHPLDDARATTVRGGLVRLEMTATKPLAPGPGGEPLAEMRCDDGRIRRFAPTEGDPTRLATEFTAEADLTFEIRLVGRDGFESEPGPTYRLEVRPDEAPTVNITRPTRSIQTTPDGYIDLSLAARDDFGIESLVLAARIGSSAETVFADLSAGDTVERSPDPKLLVADHRWDLAPMRLMPGDVVQCVAIARDNYRFEDDRHPPVRSAPLHVRVVAASEFADTVRGELSKSRQRLLDLLADVESVLDQTSTLRADGANGRGLDPGKIADAKRLADELRHAAVDARSLARAWRDIASRARRNRAERLEAARQARRLAGSMRSVAGGPLHGAVERLARVAETDDASQQNAELSASADRQGDVVAAIREMIRKIDRWNDFEDAARRIRQLLDRQEALVRACDRLSSTTIGRAREHLSVSVRLSLARSAKGQRQLARDAAELTENLALMGDRLGAADAAAGQSLLRASDIARQRGLSSRMSDAADTVRVNRLGTARAAQIEAVAILRAMLVALDEKQQRELAELSRRVRDLVARLERLIVMQRDLIGRNRAAREGEEPGEALIGLGRRQATIRSTTLDLAGRIKPDEEDAVRAAAEVGAALDAMADAVRLLRAADGEGAEPHQRVALTGLETALDHLLRLRAEVERTLGEQSLAAIRADLEKIRQTEMEIRDETAGIDARRREADRLARVDGLRLNRLANRQRDLAEPIEAVAPKMVNSIVYQHVCRKLAPRVTRAAEALRAHDCGEAIAQANRIIRDLNRLLDALADDPERDESEFVAEGGGGGGGAAGPTQAKPVPALAELKLLRMLQMDVNERTVEANRQQPDPLFRTEEELTEIESVGVEQDEIRTLAIRMIRSAAKPNGGP